MKKQIIAMSSGGFSMQPANPILDYYVLNQSDKTNPKLCFLPTASGDDESYILKFYSFFSSLNCVPSYLSLFNPPTSDLEDFIMNKDIIYVGGGNTKNLLALWKEWNLHNILKKAYDSGIILAGLSAGAICWFEEGVTDSIPGELTKLECLGYLKGSSCPHYDYDKKRRPAFHRLLNSKEIQNGIAIDDGVALHYINDELYKVISSSYKSKAYKVTSDGDEIKEEVLPNITYLVSNDLK